jgi:hypothetical protein
MNKSLRQMETADLTNEIRSEAAERNAYMLANPSQMHASIGIVQTETGPEFYAFIDGRERRSPEYHLVLRSVEMA